MWTQLLVFFYTVIQCVYLQAVTNQNDCECVPYYLCRSNRTIITNGEGNLIDTRFGRICEDCGCTVDIELCCLLSAKETKAKVVEEVNHLPCGYSNPNGITFKDEATENSGALFGEFPWMVQIWRNNEYSCGGSLIHPKVVLTAAHCVQSIRNSFKVIAGDWDTSRNVELLRPQTRSVNFIKIHEKFNPNNLFNDIALLFLNESFNLRAHINISCLIPNNSVVPSLRTCFSIGWGKSQLTSKANITKILKKIDLPIIDRKICETQLRATRLSEYFRLDKSFMCAGGEENKDMCVGDGGSPLFCEIDGESDRYEQVGIVSWGIECNAKNVPGVYTDVAYLRTWIDTQMINNNLDKTTYVY